MIKTQYFCDVCGALIEHKGSLSSSSGAVMAAVLSPVHGDATDAPVILFWAFDKSTLGANGTRSLICGEACALRFLTQNLNTLFVLEEPEEHGAQATSMRAVRDVIDEAVERRLSPKSRDGDKSKDSARFQYGGS